MPPFASRGILAGGESKRLGADRRRFHDVEHRRNRQGPERLNSVKRSVKNSVKNTVKNTVKNSVKNSVGRRARRSTY